MNRREFIGGAALCAAAGCVTAVPPCADGDYEALQREIDRVRAADYAAYCDRFDPGMLDRFAALRRLEAAFDRVKREVRDTIVENRPAVWLVYNMGIVVKTPETCFAVDLRHRRGEELAPLLDFALITHNHGDHYTMPFYAAMNGARKTVVSNFLDNYGTKNWKQDGGYTRAAKTFRIKDVEIKTGLTDHNNYLIDFTSTFEITSHGFTIYHSGDCSNVRKLNPTRTPDLWLVHPLCGMSVVDGVRKFHPKKTAIAHLNELGHDVNRWRWTWSNGLEEKARAESAGGSAIVPLWGERLS